MMNKTRESNITSGLNELEKTFQEYKLKLENAEQEAQEIIDRAWQKAEGLISDKQKEAQQNAEKIEQQARQEAERIILEVKSKAVEITRQSDEKAKKEAKIRTKQEVEEIIGSAKKMAEIQSTEVVDKAKKEAERIIREAKEAAKMKTHEQSEAIISEATKKAMTIEQDSFARADEINKFVGEVSQNIETISNQFRVEMQAQLGKMVAEVAQAKNSMETRNIMEKNINNTTTDKNAGSECNFSGQKDLIILPPHDKVQIERLRDFLKGIPGIKIEGLAINEEDSSIYINVVKPTPLPEMLQELPLVESIDVRRNTIRLQLKSGKLSKV